ncbi:cytochrome c oxidase, subunit II [Methylocaldum marinum]|uniref:Cytochrome c oxidase, subunit II n=1 Tax=Methylocaldum marinum TaxID=1432792 RepID=A0A250KQW8_9GAMM|nr:c-type cytochrome [Methylocaldum marinum]BBA33932.1 cytochrome c oxidase, subunit II [Methylocaldum marinum]
MKATVLKHLLALAICLAGDAGAAPSVAQLEREGYQVFIERCGVCHAVRGTDAYGILGPDLTHLMSRRYIGAGLLPNTVGNLGGWIADAQTHKPGCFMPTMDLTGPELQAVLAYLQTLR